MILTIRPEADKWSRRACIRRWIWVDFFFRTWPKPKTEKDMLNKVVSPWTWDGPRRILGEEVAGI